MPSSTASTPGRSGANLLKVGKDVALYGWTYARILESFQPVGKEQWRQAELWAQDTWCLLRKTAGQRIPWSRARYGRWRGFPAGAGFRMRPRHVVKLG
jgi:hypothetical protein